MPPLFDRGGDGHKSLPGLRHRPPVGLMRRELRHFMTARLADHAIRGADATAVLIVIPFTFGMLNAYAHLLLGLVVAVLSFGYLWTSLAVGLYYTRRLRRLGVTGLDCFYCHLPVEVAQYRCPNCQRTF